MVAYWVYILYSAKIDKYYIGRTENLELRVQYHNHPVESRKFTFRGLPWVLKLSIPCDSLEHSIKLEQFIKKMKSRKFVESLIRDERLRNDIIKKTNTWLLISPEASG